jgi:ABC-type transport system involved in multi-copper enzyme maturation permease subunit
MIGSTLGQVLLVMRLELAKTFFARRGLWVYLLALAPVLLFGAHSVYAPRERERLVRLAAAHPLPAAELRNLKVGAKQDDVVATLGQPYAKRGGQFHMEGGRMSRRAWFWYTDGKSDFVLRFVDGVLVRIDRTDPETLAGDSFVFATIFQFYYLRLAIFFGCLGVFMNLFRGEMLDKSLHFYLLTPVRREVLLAGKYLAGLAATVVIFTASTALQLPAMLAQFDRGVVAEYFAGPGWGQCAAYLGVTVLACVGYGSVFLAAGLFFRNPIIPAGVILFWESANLFLPAALKHISMTFYLQSLCPVAPPTDPNMPLVLQLLIYGAQPTSTPAAIVGVIGFTALVLGLAAYRVRRLEINYATE